MLSTEADELNRRLNPLIFALLSERGKEIYFPKEGIVAQSADAAGTGINATIGIATQDDGAPMQLPVISSKVSLPPADVFTYAPTYGKPALRSAWRESLYKKNPSLEAFVSIPVVTNALTHALSLAGYLFVDEGDHIITANRMWENYELIFEQAYGASIDRFNLFYEDRFDLDDFRATLNRGWGKKIVLLNFPNNPTGYSPTYVEAREIAQAIRESAENGNKIIVLIDDAYFGFFYGDCFRESMFSLLADIHPNVLAVKIDGATKEHYAWGLRVGFLTYGFRGATEDDYRVLEDKTAGAIRAGISNVSHPSQSLVLSALHNPDGEDNYRVLKRRYERTKHVLQDERFARFFRSLPFNSGYFMCLELNEGMDAEKIRQLLLHKYDTGVIVLGNLLRVAFSSVPEYKIDQLFDNIYNACRDSMHPLMQWMDTESFGKLEALNNSQVMELIEKYAKICTPARIRVLSDSEDDMEYVRRKALENEEMDLETAGHTVHFDGPFDQGRDREKTKVLLPPGKKLSKVNSMDREDGLREMKALLQDSMRGREMLVLFFCLGPADSRFSIGAMQITDSAYVAHSENILYRNGYEHFKKPGEFFHFLHASGELIDGVSANHDKKRIYIDLEKNRVFSVNTQYAGNSVGLKKLALRLAINKANNENWLTEHMFLMGVTPEGKNRKTYFAGAFPSACGKTSTAMIPGQTIVGDDIVYLRRGPFGKIHAVNIEQGIFGIIHDVNPRDDPFIYQTLVTPRELVFSNVLIHNGKPYWLGMGRELPEEGINFSGFWTKGKLDDSGNEIPPAHKNARYTMRLEELENVDENLHNPEGVPVSAVIYGGRDSDTSPPVLQSFDWAHGVFLGASLESETTAATIGTAGIRRIDPMAIHDFLVVPIGQYLANHLRMGYVDAPPSIFATNYFLKEEGTFLNEKVDKKVWLMWMEGRVNGDYDAVQTPIGFIPRYDDLRNLFFQIFEKEYTRDEYDRQFSIKVSKLLERLERVDLFYLSEEGIPEEIMLQVDAQRTRLINARREFKKDVISPFDF